MKTLKLTSLIGAFLLVASPGSMLMSYSFAVERPNSSSHDWMTSQTHSILAYNAARALRHLASAQRDIAQNNIHGAQSELGQALTVIDQMKAKFVTARLQELIAAARIRLTYQEPKKVLAYLELITPSFEDIPVPAAVKEVKQALLRAEGFLKNNDNDAADRELAALMDFLVYQTAARPVVLAEKHLLAAASELDKQHRAIADRAISASEDNLNIIAFGMYSPLFETQNSLRQAALDHAVGRWAAARVSLKKASRAIEQALKHAGVKGRDELQNLNGDIQGLLANSAQNGKKVGSSIKELWERGESLAERALDYQTATWDKFQSSRPDANDLIEAKLHVAYAEIYEFTRGETQKSAKELEKAESYLRKAELRMTKNEKTAMDSVEKDLKEVKTDLGKNYPGERERYATIRESLSQLIH
jgi:hypothetical protein